MAGRAGEAVRSFFGLEDPYVRPVPTNPWPADALVAAVLTVVSLSTMLYYRELPRGPEFVPLWPSVASVLSAGVLIAARRRFPISVLLVCSGLHFIAFGAAIPIVAALASMQVLYFLGIYTAMAYARRRDTLMLAVLAVLAAMMVWLVIADVYQRSLFLGAGFTPSLAYYASTAALNLAYFGAALWLGRNAWLQAKATDELAASKDLIRRQAAQLADRAVVEERLRIARDLHDSVAHHISLIGVQTAAARRVMATRPELAATSMAEVEELSRGAVTELRGLLGSLRDVDAPEPGGTLGSLATLCAEASGNGLSVTYQVVGDPDAGDQLPPIAASSLLRITQEALTNVRVHSTADEARVVLRVGQHRIELEVTDNGLPVPSSGGSGLGQVGMRERVAALGGDLHVGARVGQRGYRVHVTLPRVRGER